MTTLLQVALGGALGAMLRFLTGLATTRLFGTAFPWGTLFVNVAGSFAIGVLAALLVDRGAAAWAPFLMTGLLGGFTTFSAFSLDIAALAGRGVPLVALGYAAVTLSLALVAVAAGLWLGRVLQ